MSGLLLAGDNSGVITLAVPSNAGTNTINVPALSGTMVVADVGAAGTVLKSDGLKYVPSTDLTLPPAGAEGEVLVSDGMNWASGPAPSQLPTPTNGKILVANGSAWVAGDAQLSVLPEPGAVGSILVSDGDKWVRGPILANLLKTSGSAPYYGARAHIKIKWKESTKQWEIKGNPGNIASVTGPSTIDILALPTATFTFTFTTPMDDDDYLVVFTPLGRKGKQVYNNDGDIFTTRTYFTITFTTTVTSKDLDTKHPTELSVVVYK